MQSLQANIQQLCRSTAPLGMSLDYFREDFDSMSKELDFWKSEAKRLQEVLDKEKRQVSMIDEELRVSCVEKQLQL